VQHFLSANHFARFCTCSGTCIRNW